MTQTRLLLQQERSDQLVSLGRVRVAAVDRQPVIAADELVVDHLPVAVGHGPDAASRKAGLRLDKRDEIDHHLTPTRGATLPPDAGPRALLRRGSGGGNWYRVRRPWRRGARGRLGVLLARRSSWRGRSALR